MKNYRIEMKWAAVFTAVSVVWLLVEKMMGLHDTNIGKQPIYSLFFGIPAFALYILALMDKKANAYDGKMGWKEGMISGVFLTVFIAVLSPISQWIGFTIISPHFFQNAISHYTQGGRKTEAEVAALFNMGSFIKSAVFNALSMGVITAALAALILQTKTARS